MAEYSLQVCRSELVAKFNGWMDTVGYNPYSSFLPSFLPYGNSNCYIYLNWRFGYRFDRLKIDCNDHLYIYDGAHDTGTPRVTFIFLQLYHLLN